MCRIGMLRYRLKVARSNNSWLFTGFHGQLIFTLQCFSYDLSSYLREETGKNIGHIFDGLRVCMYVCMYVCMSTCYSAPSRFLLRGAPDYSAYTESEFHAETHEQLII